jgi:hypothetical protein
MKSAIRNPQSAILVAVLAAGLAYAVLRGAGWAGNDALPGVPPGNREVAWIHAATSSAAWERFVAGVLRARHDWPRLRVDDGRAFPEQTTAVPEVVLGVAGTDARIHIRWYKLTSETGPVQWVQRLARRDPPPLAFIGGGSSDRAVDLARALAGQAEWHGPAPLLLITTATANTILPEPGEVTDLSAPARAELMKIYPGRSFRFCFTNEQMAQAVVDFVWSQPDLRPYANPAPALAAGLAAAAGPLEALPLVARAGEHRPGAFAMVWDDDPYSVDLSDQFRLALHQSYLPPIRVEQTVPVPFSVGGYYRPNAWEAAHAEFLIRLLQAAPLDRQLLILPAAPAAARRVLRAVTGGLPLAGRQLVAVSGDSMNINTVYRDAGIAWNIRAVPVPVVFFTHQNPVAWDAEPTTGAGPGAPPAGRPRTDDDRAALLLPPTGTDEVLLHRELVNLLAAAAYRLDRPDRDTAPAVLIGDADELAERLRGRAPAYFNHSGDRLPGRGEFVVVVRPHLVDADGPWAQVLAAATLEVWEREGVANPPSPADAGPVSTFLQRLGLPPPNPSNWKLVKRLPVTEHGRGPHAP